VHRGANADPAGAHGAGLVAHDGERADAVPHEMVDGGEVEPGCLDRDHRGVGLAGRRRGEQVVDVDAALEDDEVTPVAEQPESPGLPGRAGRQQQDHLHPRRTTVRLGAS
jgi:hypothetical protein